MKRALCALFGHRTITYLVAKPGVNGSVVVIGAACLRCHDTDEAKRAIGQLRPLDGNRLAEGA